ncbi:MAG: hypothetical protein ACLPXM_15820 [Terriglobales bacterium]
MRESLVKSLAWVLVVLFPASLVLADATSAMLNASGNVSVNGTPIERAMAVFPGDKVQTGPNSIATLTSEGSAVTVSGNSSLVFSRSFVNVLCGTAMVATRRGMSVRVSNLLVQPARGAQARFQITQNEGQLQIIAREGTLAIDNGSTTSSLQAGRMLTAPATCMAAPYADDQTGSSQDQTQDQQDNNKKKKGGADVPSGRTVPPPAVGGSSSQGAMYGAAGAAGLAGLLVWATTRSSASNTTPNNTTNPQ